MISCMLSMISYTISVYDIIGPNPSWYPWNVQKFHDITYDIVIFLWYHAHKPFLVPDIIVKMPYIIYDIMKIFMISVVISWSHSGISWSIIWCPGHILKYHMMSRPISWGSMWDLCRTRSEMVGQVGLSLTAAASGSDSAQSMLQQHQSHLPRCLQACLAEQQPVWQNTRLGVVPGVHSESPGLLAGASGPVSVLGYFNLHVWHQFFYQYTEYRNKELRRINSEHSIVHH